MAKKENKSKKKRQAKGAKDQKIEASSSPTRELELLKSEFASLVCKYESLANKYDLDIKSFVSVRNVVPTLTSNKRRGLSLNGRC
jgi:hypothetical protein